MAFLSLASRLRRALRSGRGPRIPGYLRSLILEPRGLAIDIFGTPGLVALRDSMGDFVMVSLERHQDYMRNRGQAAPRLRPDPFLP